MSKLILVTGATGQQGGALARAALAKGHRVRGLTRNVNSSAAQELQRAGAELVQGNMEDRDSLVRAAEGVDALFAVSTPFEAGDMQAEVRQGKTVADAAKQVGVPHLVYTSVPRANEHTGIPHFDSKGEVEEYIQQLGIPHTILGPAFFMENLISPLWLPALQQGQFAIALPGDLQLPMIAVQNIGDFALLAIENRDQFVGKRIDIAGDERTPIQTAQALSRATGRDIKFVQANIGDVRAFSEDLALMFEYFISPGLRIDVPGLRKAYQQVKWITLDEWASAQNWNVLRKSA